jgi:hydrogenase maturation protein HypF
MNIKRIRCTVKGIVQGVGFRPFVYKLARAHNLTGFVINTSQGVSIEVQGKDKSLDDFFNTLKDNPPPLALISSVELQDIPLQEDLIFEIRKSRASDERITLISPDICVCDDCLKEMRDSGDRRYRYPFINCTNCGPRYTIIMDIPYDRAMTTMKKFTMCQACQREYDDPSNRRFHAQPNACWDCGPRLSLCDGNGKEIQSNDPIIDTIELLKRGFIVAIKGLGGFHLAVDATNDKAVLSLRKRKHREEKPFAIMVKDVPSALKLAYISNKERESLTSPRRPIVLLRKRRFHGLSPHVAPKNRYFGIMLPYTPVHYLLMEGGFRALVMTSGNISEEPINIDNKDAFRNLKGIADYFLVHNRDIYLRSDDSIVRVIDNTERQIRRSRGYVPVPIFLHQSITRMPSVLALGAELKNTICLTKENRAFLSQHVGDMENLETFNFFTLTIEHLMRILEIEPAVLAHDLHPDYLSTIYAKEQDEYPTVPVQHHHAHLVSCLAENRIMGPAIGITLDGTGYGLDGNIWGGEVLVGDLVSFERVGHLDNIPLPGGDTAIKFPWRMGLSYLFMTYGEGSFDLDIEFINRLNKNQAMIVLKMIKSRINTPMTSSLGRLFDAVSSILGIRDQVRYEGQAAMELEMCQDMKEKGSYGWSINKVDGKFVINTRVLIDEIVKEIKKGTSRGKISRRFHNTVVGMFTEVCIKVRDARGINEVALSGGAFQNKTLLEGFKMELQSKGFEVYTHSLVPANDGGISLGQAVCAGMRTLVKRPL